MCISASLNSSPFLQRQSWKTIRCLGAQHVSPSIAPHRFERVAVFTELDVPSFIFHYKGVWEIKNEKEPKLWSHKDLPSITALPCRSCLTRCSWIHLSKSVFSGTMGPWSNLKNCCEDSMRVSSPIQGQASCGCRVPEWWDPLGRQVHKENQTMYWPTQMHRHEVEH